MTAVIDEVEDLELIAYYGGAEDPFDRPCEANRMKCPNVALYVAIYRPVDQPGLESCGCGRQRLCLGCKDYLMSRNNPTVWLECAKCHGICALTRIEPIR